MSQALRGLAWNALAAGTDIESKITILYASPAAWSHGLLWGADTVEVPRGDATFKPKTTLAFRPNSLVGGIRGGLKAPASWYAVTLKGVHEDQAILGVLRSGIHAQMAEASFTTTTGGTMPAGSLIFAASKTTAAALDAAGKKSGLYVERNVGAAMPATTPADEAPKVAMLVSSVPASASTNSDSAGCLNILFGSDAQYVATITGSNSLENAATDPLAGENVIYNIGASWPATVNIAASPNGAVETGNTVVITTTSTNNLAVGAKVTIAGVGVTGYNGTFTVSTIDATTKFEYTDPTTGLAASGGGTVAYTGAQDRLNAFFARGGGYIAANASTSNFSFLSASGLVTGSLTQGSQSAYGGIAQWVNAGGANSPISAPIRAPTSCSCRPTRPTSPSCPPERWSTASTRPTSPPSVRPTATSPACGSTATPAANNAPVLIHGTTTASSRYVAYATNPFSRYDAEREWPLIVQAALWTDNTDK